MGRLMDRLAVRGAVLVLGFLYFRLTVRSAWVAAGLAVGLCLLGSHLIGKKWPLRDPSAPKFRMSALISRKRAPACAAYGALYMGLYLYLGQVVYLPLSLILLYLAGMGFHKTSEK